MVYGPTGNMAADMFTKPLQICLFKKFRDEIINVQKDASLSHGITMLHRSVLRKTTNTAHAGPKRLRSIGRKCP